MKVVTMVGCLVVHWVSKTADSKACHSVVSKGSRWVANLAILWDALWADLTVLNLAELTVCC